MRIYEKLLALSWFSLVEIRFPYAHTCIVRYERLAKSTRNRGCSNAGKMAAEIDCVVISDHNSGEWIDKLKAGYGTS